MPLLERNYPPTSMAIPTLADLLDVQELDSQIDRLLERRQSLPELERFKSEHESAQSLEKDLEEARGELRRIELDLDKAEGELEMLETKLDEHETRLFAGGMSARETEHQRLEVESLRGQREAREERVLAMLEELDPIRQRVTELEDELVRVNERKARLEAVIKTEWGKIDAEIARKEERKTEAASPVAEDLMELYDKLRRIKEGVAIASYENGVCGGCHMALSPAEEEEALSDEIPRCVHCRRILVA
jgi:predicted  nucleic acid-binding Zn-ribbon protein